MSFTTILIIGSVCYFIPFLVALLRGHLNVFPIFLVNLLLGWSLIGWICAFVWAFTSNTRDNRERHEW
ncbi:MAG: superinfection immunity protein [Deltaproteobacteria bacterium]|nr:superinfection immunity protein [Deltaproteobacteria bacterium]